MSLGLWDVHNHLLPGVDDGSCCMEETYDMLKEEHDQGIRNLIFTPHYRSGMFTISVSDKEQVFNRVCGRYQSSFPDMQFYLGCEYYADGTLLKNLADPRYRMNGTRSVLVEFSTSSEFGYIDKTVGMLTDEGYMPVLAHVERYDCLYSSNELLLRLREKGAMIQINSGSILGHSGGRAKRFCMSLVKEDIADIIASDAHNMEGRPVCMGECIEKITRKFGREKADMLFDVNPSKIISGR